MILPNITFIMRNNSTTTNIPDRPTPWFKINNNNKNKSKHWRYFENIEKII